MTYPVGLITSDEVIFAGGYAMVANSNYYLYTKNYFWTMSPRCMDNGYAGVFLVTSGEINNINNTTGDFGVRPVINLSSDVKLSGSGTTSDPYKIVED